jgi:hypothetical protein
MTRRLTVTWPDPHPFDRRAGAPIRLLAVSDDVDPALEHAVNGMPSGTSTRSVGCGDSSRAIWASSPMRSGPSSAFVRGNHDRGVAGSRARSMRPSRS